MVHTISYRDRIAHIQDCPKCLSTDSFRTVIEFVGDVMGIYCDVCGIGLLSTNRYVTKVRIPALSTVEFISEGDAIPNNTFEDIVLIRVGNKWILDKPLQKQKIYNWRTLIESG